MLRNILNAAQTIGTGLAGGTTKKSGISGSLSGYVFFHLQPFADNDQGVAHRKQLLSHCKAFSGNMHRLICGNKSEIALYIGIPSRYGTYFTNLFYSLFGTSAITPVTIKIPIGSGHVHIGVSHDALVGDVMSFSQGTTYMDPLKDLLSLFQIVGIDETLTISYIVKFSKHRRQKLFSFAKKAVKTSAAPRDDGDDSDDKSKEKEAHKADIYEKQMFPVSISFDIDSPSLTSKKDIKQSVLSFFHTFLLLGKIKPRNTTKWLKLHPDQFVNFFHLPTKDYFIKGLIYNPYRKLAYPSNLPTKNITLLGTTDYRADKVTFGIQAEDKFRHMYIVGKTGTGKSTFMSNLIKSDMEAGHGLCLLDPHGDLVETCLENVPTHRIQDVVLFDMGDDAYPIGFNLLQAKNAEEKHRIVSGVVGVFNKLFENSRGPRLEYILRNVLLSLVEYPNATLLHILRMLTDKNFKDEVLRHVHDPMLQKFWTEEYGKRDQKQMSEAIGPITNKVGQFLSSSLVRNIFGQYHTKLTIREAMDTGKIILVNLSKGKIGEDNAKMIGSLLVSKIQIDAMSRADIPMDQRRPFYLYIDEFQNFVTDAFAAILSEARKYKLSLIVANQYISQLNENVRDAIFGNVGTMIAFTLGYDDAEVIKSQFKNMVETNDLISLPRFTAYIRLMIDGQTCNPFSMKTMWLPPVEHSDEKVSTIREFTRQTYAIPKEKLEEQMRLRYNKNFSAQEKIMEKAMLEGYGIPEDEIDAYQNSIIQTLSYLFHEYTKENNEPDAMIVDLHGSKHVAIRYDVTAHDDAKQNYLSTFDTKKYFFVPNVEKILREKKQQEMEHKDASHTSASQQNNPPHRSIPLQEKRERQPDTKSPLGEINKKKSEQPSNKPANPVQNSIRKPILSGTVTKENPTISAKVPEAISSSVFSINNIILGDTYEGYVKLKYNYGLFITVKGVEGLCHKTNVIVPDGIESRKKAYEIGDKITVAAESFVDVKGEKRVIWTMKT